MEQRHPFTPHITPQPIPVTQTKSKSQAQLLLELTAISGEYPSDNISRLMPSQSYSKKVIYSLTADKLLKVIYKGGIRGYRLTAKGKRKLISQNPARFAGYLEGDVETNKMRADHSRRLRLHSMAQVYTLMYNAGVSIFQDAKPDILAAQPSACTISAPHFYSSREQKVDDEKSSAIRGSKAMGTLLTPTRAYAVYNTGNNQTSWFEKVEHRYKAEIRDHISRGVLLEQHNGKEPSGIMIGKSMESLELYWAEKKNGGAALSFLANTYHPFYFITNDDYGEAQLRLLCDDAKIVSLSYTLSKGLQPPDGKYPIEHDALTTDGIPVLFCCLLDIPRLIRFHVGLSLQGKIGKVIAFDFQQELLVRYLGERASITSISFEKFATRFFRNEKS